MKYRVFSFLFALIALCGLQARAQSTPETFDDPDGRYLLTLPSGWLGIVNTDALGKKDINIVFKVRENGSLKIRRAEDADPNLDVLDFAKKDEEQTLRFLPAYEKVGIEKILMSGGRSAALVSYNYKNSGQPFTGREYYVRLDEKNLWVLRFRGRQNILSTLRSHTDAMARSFKLKQTEAAAEKK